MRRVLFVVMVVLAACGQPDGGGGNGGASQPATAPLDGEWRLVSGTGPAGKIPVPEHVTLTLDGRKASGVSACNNYSADVDIDGPALAVKGMGGTAMGCPGKRMVAEERYSAALQAADTIERSGDMLDITGRDVALHFELVPPPEPAAFEDTKWRLTTLIVGRGPDGTAMSTAAPAMLRFRSDGSLTGSTGCLDVTGQWRREGDTVTVTGMPTSEADCQVAGEQNDHLMNILRSPFTVDLRVRQLDLMQVEGDLGAGYTAG